MKLILLCGLPGSGKSTFAKQYPSYVYVNQDLLKSRNACIEVVRKAFKENKSVIVDRTNINKMQRRIWILEAEKAGVKDISLIQFVVDPETCIKRITERKEHPNLDNNCSLDKIKEIVYNFVHTYEEPSISEGFKKILIIDNNYV